MSGDVLSLDSDTAPPDAKGEPLVQPVMRHGKRIAPSPSLDEIRRRAKRALEHLPEPLRRLEPGASYPVEVADDLIKLAADVDRRMEAKT
jgi:nicotinate phosphoribosyltransferase